MPKLNASDVKMPNFENAIRKCPLSPEKAKIFCQYYCYSCRMKRPYWDLGPYLSNNKNLYRNFVKCMSNDNKIRIREKFDAPSSLSLPFSLDPI